MDLGKTEKICCNISIPSLYDNVVIDNFDLNNFQYNLDFVILAIISVHVQPSNWYDVYCTSSQVDTRLLIKQRVLISNPAPSDLLLLVSLLNARSNIFFYSGSLRLFSTCI